MKLTTLLIGILGVNFLFLLVFRAVVKRRREEIITGDIVIMSKRRYDELMSQQKTLNIPRRGPRNE